MDTDLIHLLHTKVHSDLVIVATANQNNPVEYKVHKIVIYLRCLEFHRKYSDSIEEGRVELDEHADVLEIVRHLHPLVIMSH
jgi:hypothetical protein